jgi:hypothetical protein
MEERKLEKAFNFQNDNFLLRFIKKYITISSTYRNISAFFYVARMVHAQKKLLALLKVHVNVCTY